MVLYNMYIFNRYGDNIFYGQWARTNSMQEGEASLVAGFIYTLQHISSQLSTKGAGGFRAVRTPCYKLNYFETMTGYRAALLTGTDFSTSAAQELLSAIFQEVFLEAVVRNPMYRHEEGVTLSNTEFAPALDKFLRGRKLID